MLVVVPDALHDQINKLLDEAYAKTPDAEVDREYHYAEILRYFNDHGIIPDFKLERIANA